MKKMIFNGLNIVKKMSKRCHSVALKTGVATGWQRLKMLKFQRKTNGVAYVALNITKKLSKKVFV